MVKEKEKQLHLIQDREFLRNISIICIAMSTVYTIFYFIAGMKAAGFFNIIIVFFYSISFYVSRYKLTEFTRYLTLSIYIIQISFFSFFFFPANAGYHLYFLVVPLVIVFIKRHNLYFIKLFYSSISVLLFFYCELFSTKLSPMFELSEIMTRLLYASSVLVVVLGMTVIIYFFIREKEKLIHELNEAKKYAESLFDISPCAIYTVDREGRVIDFNKKAEILTGYSPEELKNRNVTFIDGNTLQDKDGKKRVIEKYSSELFDENRNVIGRIISFFDITTRIELEEFKIGIEGVIRHDLKTPLNTILGFPDLMLDDPSISDENKQYLKIIRNSGQTMLNLINLSQNLYKIENGTFEFKKEKCEVMSILKQISTDLEYLKRKKQSEIEISLEEDSDFNQKGIFINSEKTLLYMIFSNLIKNALEATPPGENIKISISNHKGFLLSIYNNGEIPQEIRETFFEKYVTRGKKNGNGLGTYSAKMMSRAIGAELQFKSSAEEGTTLTFLMRG